ncbi:MAG: DUF2339 domain-containing protein [Sulfitobacter sp.]
MEPFFALVALVVLAIPVTLIALAIGQSKLRRRLGDAESRIKDLQGRLSALGKDGPRTQEAAAKPLADENPALDAADDVPQTDAEAAQPKTPPPLAAAQQAHSPVAEAAAETPRRPSPVGQALSRLGPWLQQNWFYVVSAASLALAGVFLVQYGMENGLLPPRARVAAALGFGGALIAVGEFIRRRYGDGEQASTAYLPSVFSGAGIVTLFGGILSARMLYDLIGGGAAMIGMTCVAILAMVLGWIYGPLLVAVGVIGAYGAPLVLESSAADASPLYGYFAVIAVLGMGVDTIRRWGWISALTLVLAYFMGFVLLGSGGSTAWTGQIYFAVLPLFAILIPARGFVPDHAGPPAMIGALGRMTFGAKEQGLIWPSFPTLLAFSSVAASCVILLIVWKPGTEEIWLSVGLFTALSVILIAWSHRAPALQDAALIAPVALLLSIFAQAENRRITYETFSKTYSINAEAGFPWVITVLVAIGAVISIFALWRALRGGAFGVIWAAVAAVYAPAMAIVLEMGWQPAAVIGSYPWALHAAGLATLMVLFAERLARVDKEERLRVSFAMMSALACMAFAFVIVFSATALTVALAVTVLVAAVLDRMWNLPQLGIFIAVGVITLGYRLVADPGLEFAGTGPLAGVLLAYVGTLAAFIAALWLLRPLARPRSKMMLDSAAWSTAGLTASILLLRWIEAEVGGSYVGSHWALGLNTAIWIGLALAQIQRTEGQFKGLLSKLRWALAAVFAVFATGAMVAAFTAANPLLATSVQGGAQMPQAWHVFGPVFFNTLAAAYLAPALVLLAGAWRLKAIDQRLRAGLGMLGGALTAFWLFMAVRHFWQGGMQMPLSFGISQPEQYTYTILLLVAGAGLFYQSLRRRSAMLRKAGLAGIGLAVAKVFLVDISDLDGLTRVFSLLALGLGLAALAWLNRWAQDRDRAEQATPPPVPPH